MSRKPRKPTPRSRKFASTTPHLPPPAGASEARAGRPYVWIDGARLSLPTAWLQHRMSLLADLDDAWTLYGLWQQDYWWWSGGSPPEDPEGSFRKAVAGCRARLLRRPN